MAFKMKGWSPFKQEKSKVKPREGTVYVGDKMMSDKPMYKDHKPSSHLMRREWFPNRGWVTFPSLYQKKGVWHDLEGRSNEELLKIADQEGESVDWGDDEQGAIDFADKGSWKK